jgi:hypothetical protein
VQLKIKSPEDFWSGLMFIGFGILAIVVSRDYSMGTAMRMGPGYFPTYLGGLMVLLGAIISGLSLKVQGEGVTPFAWKPMILLSLAFLCFGWGVDHFGFVPALFGVAFLSSAAGQRFRPVESVVLSLVLVAIGVGIFVYGIELPFRLFWWS